MAAGARLARVLLLAPHFPPDHVAAAARLASFAAGLRAAGHDVTVVAPGPPSPSDGRDRVRRVPVPARGRGIAAYVAHQSALRWALLDGGLRALSEGARPDVVIVSSPPLVAALAGLDVAEAAGARLVVDVRDVWPDVLVEAGEIGRLSPAAILLRRIEARLLGRAALVTTPTESKVARLRQRTSAPVRLVVNGVDDAWCGGAFERAEAAPGEPFEVLYAGNLGRAQDVALLVRAIRLAAREPGRALRATIVGDGERASEVAAEAAASGGLARMLPPESRESVRRRLARCGCAFVSLRTEALADAVPSKMLEALALGVPVVGAVAGEAASILRASGGGVVATPGDLAGIASALRQLADMPAASRRALGESGRRFVLARYRREDAAAELSRALDGLISPN